MAETDAMFGLVFFSLLGCYFALIAVMTVDPNSTATADEQRNSSFQRFNHFASAVCKFALAYLFLSIGVKILYYPYPQASPTA